MLVEVWVGFGSKLGKFWVRIGIILTDLQYWCNPDWSPNTRRMYCKCTVNCTQCTVLYTRLVPSVHFWWKSNNLPPIFFLSISARMNECCTHLLHSILLYSMYCTVCTVLYIIIRITLWCWKNITKRGDLQPIFCLVNSWSNSKFCVVELGYYLKIDVE